MNFSKLLRFLFIAIAMITVFSLFACTETPSVPDGEESSSEAESQQGECKHEETQVNDNCESVCADCGVVLGTVDHTPAAPDAEDHCNVKCSNCGTLLEEAKHGETVLDSECYEACGNCGDRLSNKAKHVKAEDPDPNDHCNINCVNCGLTLSAGRHARTTEINDKCEEVCTACGDKMTDTLQHLDPGEGAWAFDPEHPQSFSATCTRCQTKIYKDVTSTPAGLTLIGPEAISLSLHNTRIVITVETDENGFKYAHLEVVEAGEGTITLNTGAEALKGVGKYVAVLARRNGLQSTGLDIWINSAGAIDHVGAKTVNMPISNDNSWQLIIFDFSTATQISKENGIGWTRFDMNPDTAVGDTMDIAFIAFFDSIAEAGEYYGDYVRAYLGSDACSHSVDNVWKSLGDGKIAMTCTACRSDVNVMDCTHFDISKLSNVTPKATTDTCYFTADCALCGATGADIPSLTQEQGRVLMASELNALAFIQASLGLENNGGYARYTAEYITNDGVIPYVRFTSKLAHENCLLLNNGTNALMGINQYVAILYRKTGDSPNFEILITPAGSTTHTNHSHKNGDTINDGTWRLAIIDLSAFDNVNPATGFGWTRLDVINNPNVQIGDSVDIAYVGFFSSIDKAYEHYMSYLVKYLGVENCGHTFATEWEGTGEANKMQNNCIICKQLVIADCDHVSNGTWNKTETEGVIKSTCTRCSAEFEIVCDHPEKTFNSEAGFFHYSYTCDLCGVLIDEENKNSKDALHIFTPDAIAGMAGETTTSANGTFNTVIMTDEATGLKYTHSVLSGTTKGECNLYLNRLANGLIENTGNYFAVLYRQNGAANTTGECFISSTDALAGNNGTRQTYVTNGEWTLVIFDFSNSQGWKSKDGAGAIRLDMFNVKDIADGSYFDIAYAGFFSSTDTANEFYNEFAAAYGLK